MAGESLSPGSQDADGMLEDDEEASPAPEAKRVKTDPELEASYLDPMLAGVAA
jgi:hypothetical protein